MAAVEQPPPRRTYGRARPAVVDEDDGPSLLVSRSAAPAPAPVPKASPAKALLSGFMNTNATWRGGLGGLLSDSPVRDEEEEEGENEEDLMKMMAKLSRAARTGESAVLTPDISEPLVPAKSLAPPPVAPARTLHQFSSTTLTDPPSTQYSTSRLSSPPTTSPAALKPPSQEVEAETIPVRKPGTSRPAPSARRIMESSDEEGAPPPRSRKAASPSRSPSPGSREIGEIKLSPGIRFTPTPTSSPVLKGKGKGKAKTAGPAAYLDRTAGESDAEEEARVERARSPIDDESGEEKAAVKGKKANKPLNKKDKIEMHKDMARAGRQRSYAPAKANAVHLPMSSYLPDASAIINALHEETYTTPPLAFAKSREVKLESSIVAFTSSEGPSKPQVDVVTAHLASSPTPVTRPARKSREASADDEIPDLENFLAAPPMQLKPKMDLAAIKAAALAAAAAKNKPRMSGSDSEDDFSVLPKGAVAPSRKHATIRNPIALRMMPPKPEPGAHSPHRNIQVAGRPKKPKDFTETHVDFAGKAFDHAGLKAFNNGTRKAGQKAGRDVTIPQAAIDQKMRLAHLAQVKAIAAKKQANWGRVKPLPERKGVDVEKILASANAIREHEVKEEEGIWDEDDDDADFKPEGEDDDTEDADADEEGEGDEDGIQYSREEDAADDEEDGVSVAETEKDAAEADDEDKENAPAPVDEDDDGAMIALPRATKSKRRVNRIAGSDSEDDETPRRSATGRAPLAEMPVPQPAMTASPAPMLGFDLAGFGDDEAGGFSQLFEATQLNTGTTQQDAFAGLRAAPQAFLLPSQALLPGVEISDSQKERDNALVGGGDDEDRVLLEEPKQQYLNSQGFFTQTRPAPMQPEPTQIDDNTQQPRKGLSSAWSFGQLPIDEHAGSISPPFAVKGAMVIEVGSPTQQSPEFSRLKRRALSISNLGILSEENEDADIEAEEEEDEDEIGESTSPRPPRNAFNTMMTAAKRQELREKRKKERSKWVEGEAEESDEDNAWGDVGDGDDEDGDDEEGDQYDPELVDDTKVSEEEKKLQDELAEQKMREIERADDEKRQAQAQDIIDGKHRSKRRGRDFISDDEDEDGKPRKLSKKQRRKRDLGREDGLDKLEGEENVFRKAYEDDLESDEDDTLDDPLPVSPKQSHQPAERARSPEPKRSMAEKIAMLKAQARRNREVDAEEDQRRLDEQLGFTDGFFADPTNIDDEGDDIMGEESQFSISRSARPAPNAAASVAPLRSAESWQAYVAVESQTTRRVGALAGGSVVVMNKCMPSLNTSNGRRGGPPSRSNSSLSSASGGVLRSKTSGFV